MLRSTATVAALYLVAVLIGTYLLFVPGITGPFIFDDFSNLSNLALLGDDITAESLKNYLYAFEGDIGRPLSALSFLIDDHAWPTNADSFKRTNILLHLLTGTLLFYLCICLSKVARFSAGQGVALAALTSTVWLVHPLHASTLMLVVQRMTILSAAIVIIGLVAYVRCIEAAERGWLRAFGALAAVGFAALIAILAKENGALIFAYVAAVNATIARSALQSFSANQRRLLTWTPLAATVAMFFPVLLMPARFLSGYDGRDFTLVERLLTQPRVLCDYIYQILVPRISGKGIFHDDYNISQSLLNPPTTLVAIIAVAAALTIGSNIRKSHPIAAFAVLWFAAGHLIESTIFPLELYFEHRNYLPMVGPIFALGWTVVGVRDWQRVTLLAVSGWLALMAWTTYQLSATWGDPLKLAATAVHEHPRSTRAHQFMAATLVSVGEATTARDQLDAAVRQNPGWSELHLQLLLLDCELGNQSNGRLEAALAAATEGRAAQVAAEVFQRLRSHTAAGTCPKLLDERTLELLAAGITSNPAYRPRQDILEFVHLEMAFFYIKLRNLDLAMHHLDAAFVHGKRPEVALQQAGLLISAGLHEAALHYIDKAEDAHYRGIKGMFWREPLQIAPLRREIEAQIER